MWLEMGSLPVVVLEAEFEGIVRLGGLAPEVSVAATTAVGTIC